MSDELRVAAERLRKDTYGKNNRAWQMDLLALASAYLTAHPTDDEQPITEEWLLANGWEVRIKGPGAIRQIHPVVWLTFLCGVMRIGVHDAGFLRTRGDVRRLCAALGVPTVYPGEKK